MATPHTSTFVINARVGGTYTETSEEDVEFGGFGETVWELGRRWGGGVLVRGGPVEGTGSDCTIMTLLVQRIVSW
jgi:hypothetical protein